MSGRRADTPRRLLLMRHSKAEPYGPTDRDRPLTRTGRRDAATVGRWLAEQGLVVDHALVSAAVRTIETCTEVRTTAGFTVEPDVRADLYVAEADDILAAITEVPPDVRSLLYVGHNPGVEVLAAALAGEGDRQALTTLVAGFPTSGVAVYEVPVPWHELGEGAARLEHFYVGRG
jgi:phosphohistidine phosphatase